MADNLQEQLVIEESTNGSKALTPVVDRRTVVDQPEVGERALVGSSLLQFMEVADEFVPWGTNISRRDRQLREFFKKESFLASAVYSTAIRNSSFDWEIVNADPSVPPHKNTIRATTKMLEMSDRGHGWSEFIKKEGVDLYTQDNGAFVEVIRRADNPNSPVINLAHLDASRCLRTGNPKIPVIYTDRLGKEHSLKWYQVMTWEELPSAEETLYGIQLCAVSRALKAAQIMRDIAIYKHEKISGRHPASLHVIGGASQRELNDVISKHEERMANQGLMRYSAPVMFAALDPETTVSHVQVDLASLPDGYDEQTTLQWYVAQLAIAFGVDYQEFAPLPSSSAIGSGGQSEILHMKTRGKGPATIMKMIEHKINNNNILPKSVKFQFKIQDLRADAEKSKASFERGKDRAARIQSGELDPEAAIELAVTAGDIPKHVADSMMKRLEERKKEQAAMELQQEEKPGPPITVGADQVMGGVASQMKNVDQVRAEILSHLQATGEINVNLPNVIAEEVEKRRLTELLKEFKDA